MTRAATFGATCLMAGATGGTATASSGSSTARRRLGMARLRSRRQQKLRQQRRLLQQLRHPMRLCSSSLRRSRCRSVQFLTVIGRTALAWLQIASSLSSCRSPQRSLCQRPIWPTALGYRPRLSTFGQRAALSLLRPQHLQRHLLRHPRPAGSSSSSPGSHLLRLSHLSQLRLPRRSSRGNRRLPPTRSASSHPGRRLLPLMRLPNTTHSSRCRRRSSRRCSSSSRHGVSLLQLLHLQCGGLPPPPPPHPISSLLPSQRHSIGASPQQERHCSPLPSSRILRSNRSQQLRLCQQQLERWAAHLLPWAPATGLFSLGTGRQVERLQATALTAALPFRLASCCLVDECCWRPRQASGLWCDSMVGWQISSHPRLAARRGSECDAHTKLPHHHPAAHHRCAAGHLQLHALQRGPPEVLQPLPGARTTSLSTLLQTLESFPGPLGSSSKADKVRGGEGGCAGILCECPGRGGSGLPA